MFNLSDQDNYKYIINMEPDFSKTSSDMFLAQCKLYQHMFSFINSMSLKCAVQLGIPDAIHSNKKPITLPKLAMTLCVESSKMASLGRLMRALVDSGIFGITEVAESQEAYTLTPISKLLVKDNQTCQSPLVLSMLNPVLVDPWHCLAGWFTGTTNNEKCPQTPFEAAHGVDLWELLGRDTITANQFNQAMASDSSIMKFVFKQYREVFKGLESVVDVGGGTGMVARILIDTFPELKCTVLDLPYVVEGLEDCERLKFIGGSMFEAIPSADAILMKIVLHDFSDEDCVKILKKCRDALRGRNGNEKLIVLDTLISKEDEPEINRMKLQVDLMMMTLLGGKERTEKEWACLFSEAGFSRYNIMPISRLSLIEVYP